MIIDCFIFYNELDLLNYRLNILYDVVDYFVIVESTRTFIGKEKTLYFSENKHLFEKCNNKIIHVVVDDFPHKYPNININNGEQWANERFQRNCISRGLQRIDVQNDDLIIISDVDEIPDPRTLNKIKNGEIAVECNSLEMDLYYYNLYTKFNDIWNHSKMLTYKKYKELNVTCNEIRFINFPSIRCGWHLSYFGDSKYIQNKLMHFSHQEFNNEMYTNLKNIEYRVNHCIDLYGRSGDNYALEKVELKDNTYLPIGYETYLTKFFNITHLNIAFFVRHFTERGTEVALYDYAKYNEDILHNKSYIICFTQETQHKINFPSDRSSYNKFNERFEIIEINDMSDMKDVIQKNNLSFFYTLTYGGNEIMYQFHNKNIWGNCKTIKHCVFDTKYPESDYYISISDTLNLKNNTNIPVIPHIVHLPDNNENLRNELNIPQDAIVYGRYGGITEFNITEVHAAIKEYIHLDNCYFLFMNTDKFYEHPRIIYLDKNVDLNYKVKFINTCDAMIHARQMGETFGLSLAEFSMKNKPIITCMSGDLEHIYILREKAIIYNSKEELMNIFKNIRYIIQSRNDWNAYQLYSPERVMNLFTKYIFSK